MSSRTRALVWVLRVFGGVTLFAVPFVFVPTAWMIAIHEWVSLGPFPHGPITEYLARSLSAFYAGLGALAMLFSTDVRRYRPAILLLAGGVVAFSVVVLWVDLKVGMPASWTWSEGPVALALGVVMWWLASGVGEAGGGPPSELTVGT